MASPFDSQFDVIRQKIIFYADRYGIDRQIAIAQLWQESKFNNNAVSSAGARSIAQFMPATARQYKVDVNNVDSALDGWGRYMAYLLKLFGGNYSLALAGYNAGEGNVKKYGNTIPPFNETKNYVATIIKNASADIATIADTVKKNPAASTGVALLAFGLFFWLILDD